MRFEHLPALRTKAALAIWSPLPKPAFAKRLRIAGFEVGDVAHPLWFQAKAAKDWPNKQTLSKAERLGRIFGTRSKNYPQVKPHVALMSPGPPKQLKSRLRPAWNTRDGQLIWFELKVPTGR